MVGVIGIALSVKLILSKVFFEKKSTTLDFFTTITIFIYRVGHKNPYIKDMEHKRKYRELDDRIKQSIGQALRGKPKSESHKQHLSQALQDYWKTVPSRGNNEVKSSNTDDE